MDKFITLQEIDEAAQAIRARMQALPRAALILGSGLGSLADACQSAVVIPYRELPNWPVSTVQGHEGRLVIGTLEGQPVLMMQGRVHYYEGYSMSQVVMPVRVMQRLGIECLIVTNGRARSGFRTRDPCDHRSSKPGRHGGGEPAARAKPG
jgi:purine-nucleoside phosphorylase